VLFCYKIKPKIPLYLIIKSRNFSRPHQISSQWQPFATADYKQAYNGIQKNFYKKLKNQQSYTSNSLADRAIDDVP